MVILSTQLLANIRQIRTGLLNDVQAGFSPDAFTAYERIRPTTPGAMWDDGTADERWSVVSEGYGILRANGNGGPVIGEDVIYQQAPYVFRTDRAALLRAGLRLVVGMRQFNIEAVPEEDNEDPIVYAYLTELFGEALPEVTP